jgi:hypothetical protein
MCVVGLEACPFQQLHMGIIHIITCIEGTGRSRCIAVLTQNHKTGGSCWLLNPRGGGETHIHGTGGWVGTWACQQLYMLIQNTRFGNFLTLVGDRNKSVDDCNNNVRCGGCFTPQLDSCWILLDSLILSCICGCINILSIALSRSKWVMQILWVFFCRQAVVYLLS